MRSPSFLCKHCVAFQVVLLIKLIACPQYLNFDVQIRTHVQRQKLLIRLGTDGPTAINSPFSQIHVEVGNHIAFQTDATYC